MSDGVWLPQEEFDALTERANRCAEAERERDEWKEEAALRGLPKELMQRLHRAEFRLIRAASLVKLANKTPADPDYDEQAVTDALWAIVRMLDGTEVPDEDLLPAKAEKLAETLRWALGGWRASDVEQDRERYEAAYALVATWESDLHAARHPL